MPAEPEITFRIVGTPEDCAADELYVFVSEASFGPKLTVQVRRDGEQIGLVAFRRNADFGAEEHRARRLTAGEWERLQVVLDAGFWGSPESAIVGGLDGSAWTFYGRRHGEEHQINRWSPSDDATVDMGKILSELAGLPLA